MTFFDYAEVPQEERENADRQWGVGKWVACRGDCPLYSGSVPQRFVIHGKDAHSHRPVIGEDS